MNDQAPSTEVIKREQRRQELAELAFSPTGQLFQPRNGRELMDMANMMSTAGFMVKDIYRGNPGACMGLIAICTPYGLNPLQVSWKTYKASKSDDAPIAFEAQVIVAMINARNVAKGGLRYTYEGEGQNRVCICSGILAGESLPVEVRSPPLGMINPKNSPLWKSDPDQQLAYYTGRSWARRYKPEILLGVYDVDEVETMRDITPPRQAETGFARLAADARRAHETPAGEAEDASEVQGEDHSSESSDPAQERATDGTEAPLPEQTAEGEPTDEDAIDTTSTHYANGSFAAQMGAERSHCPRDLKGKEAAEWLAGYDSVAEQEDAE